MPTKEEIKLLNKYENMILGLIDYQDDYTRSDLQGAVGAIVIMILNKGKQLEMSKK